MEELPLQISAHKAPADGELDGKWQMGSGSGSSWLLGVFTRRLTDFPHARERVCRLVVGGKIYIGSAAAPLRWQKCSTMALVQTMLNARSLRAVCQLGSSGSPNLWPIAPPPAIATRSIPASDSGTMRMRMRKRSALVAIIDINASQLAF